MLQDYVAHASGPNDWGNWSAKARIEDLILVVCMMPAMLQDYVAEASGSNDWGDWTAEARKI